MEWKNGEEKKRSRCKVRNEEGTDGNEAERNIGTRVPVDRSVPRESSLPFPAVSFPPCKYSRTCQGTLQPVFPYFLTLVFLAELTGTTHRTRLSIIKAVASAESIGSFNNRFN